MPQWQSCFIGFLWGHSHSDWLPVSVLGYTEFFLAPKREVGPDSHYALLWRARKGYNAGSFWLGTAQLGLALLGLPFPSILNFNEWQLHEHQWRQWWWSSSRWKSPRKSCRRLSGEEKVEKIMWCTNEKVYLTVHPSNSVNSSTAAAATIISQWQRTLSCHNNSSIQCLVFSHFHTVPQSFPLLLLCPVPSSHPPTVSVWRSLCPRWARVRRCQAEKPQGRALFEPLLSPWFDAVHLSVVGCLCQALQEVHYFRPLQRQSLSLPPSLKIPFILRVLLSCPPG